MSQQAPATAPAQQVCCVCLCCCKEGSEFGEVVPSSLISKYQRGLQTVAYLSTELCLTFAVVLDGDLHVIGEFCGRFSALQVLWALCQLHEVGQERGILGPRGADWGGVVPCGSWGSGHAVGHC